MSTSRKNISHEATNSKLIHCNHPLAVVVDPTDQQVEELEAMLSKCPNCSRWTPGDGPIMAVISTRARKVSQAPTEAI